MRTQIILWFIIGFFVLINTASIPQLKDKINLTEPDHEIEIVEHLKTDQTNQQLSALFQDNDDNPSGSGGRSFWSWFRGIFRGNGNGSGDAKDPDDILPFGWGNDLVDTLNTVLGRVNTILKVNVVLQPKVVPNELRKNVVKKSRT